VTGRRDASTAMMLAPERRRRNVGDTGVEPVQPELDPDPTERCQPENSERAPVAHAAILNRSAHLMSLIAMMRLIARAMESSRWWMNRSVLWRS